MKYLAILVISAYRVFFVYPLKSILGVNNCCRFEETCSSYAKRMLGEYGFFKGTGLSLMRLLKCQPFYNLS